MPTGLPIVRIENDKTFTRVFINGEQVKGVQGVSFSHSVADKLPVLRLDLLCDQVTIDSDEAPQLPEAYHFFYTKKNEP